ncbi:hypothetical protein PX699_27430 [Sphingobium sp. H39-3-25]|uniref:hypothetical protein n=1 Tax=Sphingobium arseniciresistens TaxID=3030834 RepID=UPI0023B9075C|nr:hypothetical protein [Sphingobium arseniciresistens]
MARKQKLKVFRTPIGFHDAYVAAPSRKAALEAWGSDADLFARGIAEEVIDEALMQAPLERPGAVIRIARGSEAEHLAAAGPKHGASAGASKRSDRKSGQTAGSNGAKDKDSAASGGMAKSKLSRPPQPRPSRDALEAAEAALKELSHRQRNGEADLRRREQDLERLRREIERERRDLDRSHGRERDEAERKVKNERKKHSAALDKWIADQE